MISRDEAVSLLKTYAKENHDLLRKSYAVEHIMRKLCHEHDEDEELWEMTGLLYDLDIEYTQRNPENHTMITADLLNGLLPQEAIDAIKSHNYAHTGVIPTSMLDKALLTSDASATLILAISSTIPLQKITKKDLLSAYKDLSYDIYYHKDWLLLSPDLNMNIQDFLFFSLSSLKEITGDYKQV